MTQKKFKRIALTGRPGIKDIDNTLNTLTEHLIHKTCQVFLTENGKTILPNSQLTVLNNDELKNNIDLIIVVGGDGSLLNAAHLGVAADVPVLGINRGRLGFLTDIPPNHLNKIDAILAGDYLAEKRSLLNAEIKLKNKVQYNDIALNDVVLMPGDIAQMIEFEVNINGKMMCRQRADGLIVTTPTGSTAYALSGGGPILHPTSKAIALVPMFPHRLSSRPIVVNDDSEILIRIISRYDISPHISCDGQNRRSVAPGTEIFIQRLKSELTLIHPSDYDYFSTLREKLGWEKRNV